MVKLSDYRTYVPHVVLKNDQYIGSDIRYVEDITRYGLDLFKWQIEILFLPREENPYLWSTVLCLYIYFLHMHDSVFLGSEQLIESARELRQGVYLENNLSRVIINCPSHLTIKGLKRVDISACGCSVWRDSARLGELTRLNPFTWGKLYLANWVTLAPEPGIQFSRKR